MKKVVNVGIGGRSFTIDEDAYSRMDLYLQHFRSRLTCPQDQVGEVMNDIEGRIAELLVQETGYGQRVVSLDMVNKVASQLGMPDGSAEPNSSSGQSGASSSGQTYYAEPPGGRSAAPRKLYRDPDDKVFGGVCSGVAAFFNIDVSLVRIIMVVALLAGTVGFWAYIILWVVLPAALTPAQKCELRGIYPTAENMAKFSTTSTNGQNRQ